MIKKNMDLWFIILIFVLCSEIALIKSNGNEVYQIINFLLIGIFGYLYIISRDEKKY